MGCPLGYNHSLDHITDELARFNLLLNMAFARAMARAGDARKPQGLFLHPDEIARLIDRLPESPEETGDESLGLFRRQAAQMRAAIDRAREESRTAGVFLSLDRLALQFHLTPDDLDILTACLAMAVDPAYGRIYAFLQDDMGRTRPGVNLLLTLIGTSLEHRLRLRRRVEPGAPLIDFNLIEPAAWPSDVSPGLIDRYVTLDERIVSYLLDEPGLDPSLSSLVRFLSPPVSLDDLVFSPEVRRRLTRLIDLVRKRDRGMVLYFYGPPGTGRKSMALALGGALGIPVLAVDLDLFPDESLLAFGDRVRRILREAILQNACLYWENAQSLLDEPRAPQLRVFARILSSIDGLCVIEGRYGVHPSGLFAHQVFIPQAFEAPSYAERLQLWDRMLTGIAAGPDVSTALLASTFVFTGGQIGDAVKTARRLVDVDRYDSGPLDMDTLQRACRSQAGHALAALAQKRTTSDTWDDLVLPGDRMEQLRAIVDQMRYRSLVFGLWGFDKKLSYGKGLHVLFAGPSGTGKTMAAGIMAADLGLDLYKIDLARMVSKYIGETEKNLSAIFDAAQSSQAILFFDEADALFGKRSEIHDAHDRYANIETSYLLQKMEEYEGMTILSTNFRRNMDEAFVRRLQFVVDFPFPDRQDRKRIWEGIWPPETPRDGTIDWDDLARRFELTGGHIRNIGLAASFIAAADGRTVTSAHLLRATRREFLKMGKLMTGGEFNTQATEADIGKPRRDERRIQ